MSATALGLAGSCQPTVGGAVWKAGPYQYLPLRHQVIGGLPAGTGRQLTASNIPNILLHRALRLYLGVGNSANKCGLRSERTGKMSKLCPKIFFEALL